MEDTNSVDTQIDDKQEDLLTAYMSRDDGLSYVVFEAYEKKSDPETTGENSASYVYTPLGQVYIKVIDSIAEQARTLLKDERAGFIVDLSIGNEKSAGLYMELSVLLKTGELMVLASERCKNNSVDAMIAAVRVVRFGYQEYFDSKRVLLVDDPTIDIKDETIEQQADEEESDSKHILLNDEEYDSKHILRDDEEEIVLE